MRLLLELVDERLELGARLRVAHRGVALDPIDELTDVALLVEFLTKHVERALRFGAGKLEHLEEFAARRLGEHVHKNERDDPCDENPPTASITNCSQASEHDRRLCGRWNRQATPSAC